MCFFFIYWFLCRNAKLSQHFSWIYVLLLCWVFKDFVHYPWCSIGKSEYLWRICVCSTNNILYAYQALSVCRFLSCSEIYHFNIFSELVNFHIVCIFKCVHRSHFEIPCTFVFLQCEILPLVTTVIWKCYNEQWKMNAILYSFKILGVIRNYCNLNENVKW